MKYHVWPRHDTFKNASAIVRLCMHPVAISMAVITLVVQSLHLPHQAEFSLITVASISALLSYLWWTHWSLNGRVRRNMVALKLVEHRGDRVIGPSCRGRRRMSRHHVRLRWKLPKGVTLRDVLNQLEAIEHSCNAEVICSMNNGRLVMDLMRAPIPELVRFDEFYSTTPPSGSLVLGLGRSHMGPIWADLADLPHLLIGGMTGGGKSVFLNQALTHLVVENTPDGLRLCCIDLKGGVELSPFGTLPHSLHETIASIEGAAEALSSIRAEVDRRLIELRDAGARDVDEWHALGRPRWPRIVVVVDEVAELTVRETGGNQAVQAAQKAATGRLSEIARLGRAAGVHLIVCTQRPDAEAVPGQLKANLPATVAFRVRAAVNSVILLESDRAALLPHVRGRAIWAHERLEEFQAIYLSREDTMAMLEGVRDPSSTRAAERVTPRLQTASWNWERVTLPRIFRPRKFADRKNANEKAS
jgi:DNA segregation ATPase FtsK/SpoIIIE, S-DNA-T family